MNDIRELIRKLVELNSSQGIEKVIVRQAGKYGNIVSVDSIHVEDGFAVIETEIFEKAEKIEETEEVPASVEQEPIEEAQEDSTDTAEADSSSLEEKEEAVEAESEVSLYVEPENALGMMPSHDLSEMIEDVEETEEAEEETSVEKEGAVEEA